MAAVSDRVLIVGIDSFTGKHLSSHLENEGYDVYGTALNDEGGKTLVWNILESERFPEILKAVAPHYVIHLAGISFVTHGNAEDFYRVNTLATERMLQALARYHGNLHKIILASSAAVYGNQGVEVLEESLCPAPTNHYGASKLAIEHLASTYRERLPLLLVRPFNYTGPGQSTTFLIPKIVDHFRRAAPTISLGNIDVIREFNDVRYVAEIYARLLRSDARGIPVNLCSGRGVSIREILDIMQRISGREIEVEIDPDLIRKNEIKRLVGSTERLGRIIDLPAPIPLEETLRSFYEASER
ncbi:GDP-mannose 4,6-dehydratase [Thermococcus sp.]|uniref:NAD-dependent epimerase/dehydratase family protein n=1 Tax=Thermococcus sp. TaxID=35749 RepID=UPI00261B25E4|nr:GDP-mannose 4,6-dehydratase [Thermococcus sp.]